MARCPYLGQPSDPDTWINAPVDTNVCHRTPDIHGIRPDYQETMCLSERYTECPLYQSAEQCLPDGIAFPVQQPRPPIDRAVLKAAVMVMSIGLILAGVALFVLLTPSPEPAAEEVAFVAPTTPTVPITPTQTARPTSTPLVLPTLIPLPTAVSVETDLDFASNLRTAPETDAAIVTQLPANTTLTLTARDDTGTWARATSGEHKGWIADSQLAVDLNQLPVYAPPVSNGGVGGSQTGSRMVSGDLQATESSGYPEHFDLEVAYLNMGSCAAESFVTSYEGRITEATIHLSRHSESNLIGVIDLNTGVFSARDRRADITEHLEGTLTVINGRLRVEGIHHITYASGCTTTFSLSGGS